MKTRIHQLHELGQSVWCDNLSRRMIESEGEGPHRGLRGMIRAGIVGVTSNPTIFMKAITGSRDYDRSMGGLIAQGRDVHEVYEGLVLADIADAADLLRPTHEQSNGLDGFVSLEVNPKLAYDTQGTIDEGRRLFSQLNRPNVLIKVPATHEGIPAVERLISEGVNVNITLIFSLELYENVMQAYLSGLRRRAAAGGELSRVASVASFFVSRVDTLVDKLLKEKRNTGANVDELLGQAAVANAKVAYALFEEVFAPEGAFRELAARGARVQRPLWASTSTKDPTYPDTKYVDNLIGENTVNTLPGETISAVLDHVRVATTLREDRESARTVFRRLADVGIDFNAVTEKLLADGVAAFAQSFDELLAAIAKKQDELRPMAVR